MSTDLAGKDLELRRELSRRKIRNIAYILESPKETKEKALTEKVSQIVQETNL